MRVGAEVHVAPSPCTSWLHLGLRVQLRSEFFELCRGCRLTPISRCVHSSRSTLNQGPFPPRSLPASSVVRALPTPGLRHALTACSGRYPAPTRSPVLRTSPCAHMPRPTTPVVHPAMLMSTFSPGAWPSLYVRQVGSHDCPFGACSGFTHVAACKLARPPFEAFCLWASSPRVAPRPRQIATEGVDFLLGRDFHPLVKCTFTAHAH
jgi:hypothetical protein